jgi:DNA-binding transcriptional LysR family regulator
MQVFIVVCEELSFALAARRLNMSPATVTRAIASLEKRLGTLLLSRTTRNVRLSEAGQRFLIDCKRILSEIDEAESSAGGNISIPSGQLTVTAPQMFGEQYIMPIIVHFLNEYPDVTVNTLLLDRVTNMAEEGIDVAIRIGDLKDDLQHGIKVGEIRRVICASPDYLNRNGRPSHPSELHQHRVVVSTASTLLSSWEFEEDGKSLHVTPDPRLTVSANPAAIRAASLGWGLTRVLSYQIADKISTDELEIVLDEYEQAPLSVHVCFQADRKIPAKVSSFVDFCISRFSENPAFGQYERKKS